MGRHAHVAHCRVREVTGFSSWPISDPLDFLPVDGFFFLQMWMAWAQHMGEERPNQIGVHATRQNKQARMWAM